MGQTRRRGRYEDGKGDMEDQEYLLPGGGSERRRSSTSSTPEWRSIAILLFLYVLQGVPLGLGSAFQMFLQNRHISYKQQALFSFVTWPFSIKFLWAPLVDSLHIKKFGRRKSWLVPVQYLIGAFLLTLAYNMDSLLGDEKTPPNIPFLTCVFFALNFLAATQDIAVDGWALTMLSRRNVGHASTCNTVGQTAGYFIGYVVFLGLESKEFASKYIYGTPQETGLVTIPDFLSFFGWLFFISTTLVALFKSEKEVHEDDDLGVVETYKLTWKILKNPAVLQTALFLLTCKIGFGVTDNVTALKFIEAGVPKENLALLSIPMTPVQIIIPFFIRRFITGSRPLDVFIKSYPYRLLFGIIFAFLVKWTFSFQGEFPVYYYGVILIVYAAHQVVTNSGFVALMAFFAKVSDPTIGGTYMTLLNTLCNLGGNWPATLSMSMIDTLTWKLCSSDSTNVCATAAAQELCKSSGGTCGTTMDGFYVESALAVAIGFVWLYIYGKRVTDSIQRRPMVDWQCRKD